MDIPKISIIVPVYKAEKFLSKCVDSVISQTYENFELILVDDGSPDNSGNICDLYANSDSRIKVFHKNNGGVSSARNEALKHVTGDWITFLDSDDYLSKVCLETCIQTVLRTEIDVLLYGLHKVNINGKIIGNISDYTMPMEPEKFLKTLNRGLCMGGIFIRQSIVTFNNIRFIDELKLGEDQIFLLNCIVKSRKVQSIDKCLYYYLDNDMGSSLLGYNPKELLCQLQNFVKFKCDYPISSPIVDNQIIASMSSLVITTNDFDTYLREVIKMKLNISRHFTFKRKIFLLIAKFNFSIVCFISRALKS